MDNRKKYFKGPPNVVYNIDGASFGMDDSLVDAIRTSIRSRLEKGTLVIPRLPQVAMRILQLAQDPDAQGPAVARAVMGDPVLAARVLAMANSAASGGQVKSLDAAITRLGLRTLCNVVFTESVQTKVFPARSYRRLIESSWRLSLGSAVACEALARATGVEKDAAFLIGLLHETGVPTLVTAIGDYEKKNDGRPLGDELVEIVLSQLHEEIGAYVLEQWKMPEATVEAARLHHRYLGERGPTSHRLLYAANLICQHLGVGVEEASVQFNLEHAFVHLGLSDPARIDKVLAQAQTGLESMLSAFGATAEAT